MRILVVEDEPTPVQRGEARGGLLMVHGLVPARPCVLAPDGGRHVLDPEVFQDPHFVEAPEHRDLMPARNWGDDVLRDDAVLPRATCAEPDSFVVDYFHGGCSSS